jgi:hypothetical protein
MSAISHKGCGGRRYEVARGEILNETAVPWVE